MVQAQLAVFLCLVVGAIVVAGDAARRGANSLAWGLVAFLLGPLGWLIWLASRPARPNQAPPLTQPPTAAAHAPAAATPVIIPRESIEGRMEGCLTRHGGVLGILFGLIIGGNCIEAMGRGRGGLYLIGGVVLGVLCVVGGFSMAWSSTEKKYVYYCPLCNQKLHEFSHQAGKDSIGSRCPRCNAKFWC